MGDTVGSLSEAQHSIIVGSLLGDGSMRCKTNALLEINHSAKQACYVQWKYEQLAELVLTPPKLRNGNGGRLACRFVTRSLPSLTTLYRDFYVAGVKRVPILTLTPLALAVWFMDDGCISRTSVYLNTQQFDLRNQQLLLDLLRNQWRINGTLNRDKAYHRIRISVDGTTRLAQVIRPHLLPSFEYKLPRVTP